MRESLLLGGFSAAPTPGQADVVVLNTCTVTGSADAQSREAIRKIHRANARAKIVVTGCYAQRAPEELAALDGVTAVVGNAFQTEIAEVAHGSISGACASLISPAALRADAMSLARGPAKILTNDIFGQVDIQLARGSTRAEDRTRPILKIQDGCNNRCSYCVIPSVRGRSRSLTPDSVIEEIEKLVGTGAREIVLSGINLGSYGRDLSPQTSLMEICRRILEETAIERLRFSSIEPQDITEEFAALAASSKRIAPHFHVPLQSGSDRILRAMHRRYRAAHYAARIEALHRMLPDASIGADVIAGFPGETREDFQTTVDLIRGLPLSYLHVFSFSARPGTKAEAMEGGIAFEEIRERARLLREVSQEKAAAFRRSQTGRTLRALTLHRHGAGWTEAITGNYLRIRTTGDFEANTWLELPVTATLEEMAIPASSLEAPCDSPYDLPKEIPLYS